MSQYRKFHLNDLPEDKIYVYLNNDFRKQFFRDLYLTVGSSTILSRIIKKVMDEEIRRWKVGERAIPLWALFAFNNLLNNKYTISELERNITGYKSRCSIKITKGFLPIVEDERLIRIVTHLICDGYDGGVSHPPAYSNTEPALIKSFKNDLTVFGSVPVREKKREYNDKNWKILYTIEFPRVFRFIFKHIYKISFGSRVARLPKEFFNLSKKLSYQIIKSFADDESHVGESGITFISSNLNLLEDLRRLIILQLPVSQKEITDIKYVPGAKAYNFSLKRRTLNAFYQYVNFDHPYKRKLLEFVLSRKSTPGNKFKEGEAQKIILKKLLKKPSTALELSLQLGIKGKNIRYHLFNLEKSGYVTKLKQGRYNIWCICNDKENMLYERS